MNQIKLVLTAVNSTEAEFFLPFPLTKTAPADGYYCVASNKYNGPFFDRYLTSQGAKIMFALRCHPHLQFSIGHYGLYVEVPRSFDIREELFGVYSTICKTLFACAVKSDVDDKPGYNAELAVVPRADTYIRSAFTPQPVPEEFFMLIDQTVDWMRKHERAALEVVFEKAIARLANDDCQQHEEARAKTLQSPRGMSLAG